jgi:hypothetical protein
MTAAFKIFREQALPTTLENDSLYVVAPGSTPDYIELYAVNSVGSIRRIPTLGDITTKINTALAGINSLTVVNDFAALNALHPATNEYVLVINATGDTTVASGGASYVYSTVTGLWTKVSETANTNLIMNWSTLIGKPNSTPAEIDAAVSASHPHLNKATLDKIGENGTGHLTFNGIVVSTEWASVNW